MGRRVGPRRLINKCVQVFAVGERGMTREGACMCHSLRMKMVRFVAIPGAANAKIVSIDARKK